MDTLTRVSCFTTIQNPNTTNFPFRRTTSLRRFPKTKLSLSPVSEVAEEDVLFTFFEERKSNGDIISKACDMLWQREVLKFIDANANKLMDTSPEEEPAAESNPDGGFLKLSSTREWVLGANSAPANKKALAKALQDERDKRKKLYFLQYEAIKRELMLLSVGIGSACSGYCLIVFSFQAAVSYAIGVLFSCLYLQLLYRHADNLSKEMVPEIFTRKKIKEIGIGSEDVKDLFERSVRGTGIALSSPRLVIPVTIYAFWVLSHQYLANDFFDFQLVPAMHGMFVYKAAALVQVYRDNEDLRFVFPENEEGPE